MTYVYRLCGEENADSHDPFPQSAIVCAGDVLVLVPYLVIGVVLWCNRGSTGALGHKSFGIFLLWVSL